MTKDEDRSEGEDEGDEEVNTVKLSHKVKLDQTR